MLRKICLILCTGLLLVSCQSDDTENTESQVTSITIAEFNTDPEGYMGQTLTVSGTVDHVCRHGGKKMFITGDTPEERMKIETGESIGSFAVELEGSEVTAQGVVQLMKVDNAYLDEWETGVLAELEANPEAGVQQESETAGSGKGVCEADDHHAEANTELEQIGAYRKELEETGKEYIGFYSLVCDSFEELGE